MGASSSAGPERPVAGRSIRSTFGLMVVIPAVGLVLLWGLAAGIAFDHGLAGRGFSSRNYRELAEFGVLIIAGLIIVLVAAIVMSSFARRLSRDISDLAAAAEHLADEQSPQRAERPQAGVQAAQPDTDPFRQRTKAGEIAQAAAAIARLRRTAAAAATSEAGLRNGLRQVFVSLARRNQSLLQRQLRLIDALEQKASDPAALADLFALDHLTTRMRRHAESLAILSDAAPGRSWREPVPVIDVIRGAMAEVEDYKRVTVLTRAEDAVAGSAVADMIHLIAELIENATLFSPSGTRVEVRAGRAANGFAIEIDDRGLGIEADQLGEINQQLATPPDFDLANADRLGLFVGGKLAARHGVRISLRPSPYGGTTAIVLMPNSIVVPAAGTSAGAHPDARSVTGRPAGLNLRGTEALAPAERRSALPSRPAAVQPETVAAPLQAPARTGPAPAGPPPIGPVPAGAVPADAAHVAPAPAGPVRVRQPIPNTYRGLPRRTRQANLSPHLRDSALTAVDASQALSPPAEARAPEQARDLAASLQRGWQRGRETDPLDAQPVTGAHVAGQQDSEASHGEEA